MKDLVAFDDGIFGALFGLIYEAQYALIVAYALWQHNVLRSPTVRTAFARSGEGA